MRRLSVYYCKKCGHYGYFQLQKNAICPTCSCNMQLLDITYQEFMDFDLEERDEFLAQQMIKTGPTYIQSLLAREKAFNSRKTIGYLTTELNRLEADNQQLNSTVEWMHDTIWDLLRQTKALQRKLEDQSHISEQD